MFTKDTNTKDMKKMEDMENRNNHKNQKTVKTVKTDKTASANFSEILKSLMPFFANNEKKGSRVKEGEAQTNLQLISFLSPTTVSTSSRRWAHIAAMVAMLLIIGVGDVWGTTSTLTLQSSTSRTSGWTNNGVTWTFSNITFDNSASACVDKTNGQIVITPPAGATVTKISVTKTSNAWAAAAQLKLFVGSSATAHTTLTSSSSSTTDISITGADQTASSFKFTNTTSKNCWVQSITITFTAAAVATPTFSPVAGTYNNNQSVTISCATASSNIYYTTNGTTPTSSSTAYTGAITVSTDNTTINAIAIKGGDKSSVASATYRLTCATPTFSVAEGTYNNDQSVTLSCETEGAAIHYTIDGSDPTSSSPTYSSALSISSTQTLKAIAIKSGYTNSSIASAAYTMVCSNPTITLTGGTYYNDQSTTITTTTAGATIRYTLDGTTPTESSAVYSSAIAITSSKTLKAKVFKSGYTASSAASAAYTLKCEQPSLSAETNTSIGSQDITITCGTTDAVIRYTLDGSDPTESSTIYTSAITFSTTKTLKARAFKSGYTKSDQKSGTYTIKCAVPTASPAAGTHSGPQDVELSTTYGDKIYYTLTEDGTAPGTPSESSTEYDGPIHMTVVTKIKAIAWKDGCSNSNQLSGTFTIQYNVTWMVDGTEWSDKGGSTTVNGGGHISTLPTEPTTGEFCGDRFMGWTDAEGGAYVHGSSGLYTTASGFPNATGDQVFYAVFADYAE